MIPIPNEIAAAEAVLAGDPARIDNRPVPVWDAARMAFLADLSRRLLARPDIRELADVAAFAYWARKANLSALHERLHERHAMRVGLGLTFHICPSNVPVNFAFSMAFGLLAGNACVLRLPSSETRTAEVLVDAIAALLETPEHQEMGEAVLLLRYPRNDDVNAFWLGQADGRIVWGGDATIEHMRRFAVPPRSREVTFADRYSLCLMAPDPVLALDDTGLESLCGQLYNDIYLMDQAACSSPQLIAWVGEPGAVEAAKQKLWPVFATHVDGRYEAAAVDVMDKFVRACEAAITTDGVSMIERHGNTLYRIELDALSPRQDECRGYGGTVHEITLLSLQDLAPVVNERYQTLTYFGHHRDELTEFVVSGRLRGIDRVVPVGQALDMDAIWDGYDIVGTLSRIVDVR